MFRGKWVVLFIACASFIAQGQQPKSSIASIESLIRFRQYDQALDAIKSALHETPSDFRLYTLEGLVFSMKGNKQDALAAFHKALVLSPKYPAALKGEVELLYEARDKRAIPLLKEILNADPKDETAHEMLAVLEAKQGECSAANEQFLLSADTINTHPDSLEIYGYCLVQTKEAEKAVPVFEQVVALLPEPTYPKYDLAVALVESKQNEAALKILETLLAADQSDPALLSLASEAYEAVGNTPKAVVLLRQAIVLSSATASYYVAFAVLCLDHESFQVGIDMLNAGLMRISDDPSLYLSRGLLYAQLAQYELAEADFKKAEQLDSAQSLSSYALDLAEVAKNNPDKALSEVRSQLKTHPDSPLLHFLLARLLWNEAPKADSPASDEAMKSVQQALKLNPGMVEARDLLANMYLHSEQYKLAIEQCRLALTDVPSDQSAMYHLIIALRHSGPDGQREVQALVKQLSDLKQTSRQQETERKRFKLVEQEPSSQQ
jgi:tetratricopeptide (TPR) repeat protein